jgi:hypothetical protein
MADPELTLELDDGRDVARADLQTGWLEWRHGPTVRAAGDGTAVVSGRGRNVRVIADSRRRSARAYAVRPARLERHH